MDYSLALCGFKPENITSPFASLIPPVESFFALVSSDPRSIDTYKRVKAVMEGLNITTFKVHIDNVFNFFEVMVSLEGIRKEHGKPRWINVTAGPGIAISSLTLFSIENNIPVVFYNENDRITRMVNLSGSKGMFKHAYDNKELLKLLWSGSMTIDELSGRIGVSKSTISRRLRLLKTISIVNSENVKKKMHVSLTETGRKIIKMQYPELQVEQ